MKNILKHTIIAVFMPVLCFLAESLILYVSVMSQTAWEYMYLFDALFLIVPVVPGIVIVFLLTKESEKEYLKTLCVYFIVCALITVGYLSMWEGGGKLFLEIPLILYMLFCGLGAIVAGVRTLVRRKKEKIDFSNYRALTQKSIIGIRENGVQYSDGFIKFSECQRNFILYHDHIDGNFIGVVDRSGSDPSIVFYTAPKTTHFVFMEDRDMLDQMIKTINQYGYAFVESENVY